MTRVTTGWNFDRRCGSKRCTKRWTSEKPNSEKICEQAVDKVRQRRSRIVQKLAIRFRVCLASSLAAAFLNSLRGVFSSRLRPQPSSIFGFTIGFVKKPLDGNRMLRMDG